MAPATCGARVTAAQGRAQFDGLPAGARVHVVAVVDGERLESIEFAVPAGGRRRARCSLPASGAGRPAGAAAAEAPAASPRRRQPRTRQREALVAGRRHQVCDRVPGRSVDGVLPARDREPIVGAGDRRRRRSSSSCRRKPSGARADAGRIADRPASPARASRSPDRFAPGVTQVPIAFRIESWPCRVDARRSASRCRSRASPWLRRS